MKLCPRCKEEKPLADFFCSRGRFSSYCKVCVRIRRTELRAGAAHELRVDNRTGARGVSFCESKKGVKKYRASCKVDKHYIHLGWYEEVLDAICAASDFRLENRLNPGEGSLP